MSDTVVACLTPAGTGAIATLAVHGPDAWNVCRGLFTPRSGSLPERPEDVTPNGFILGLLGTTLRDEAVLALRRSSPMPWVELHCHGGREVVRMLLEVFEQQGVRVISWREWLARTESSSLRAAAASALASAPTVKTAAILLDQYHGAMDSALARVKEAIERGDIPAARQMRAELLRHADVGRHLTKPWRVVVAGAPNVGKSSLVNTLAGYQRCVVSETPGTTRDVVTTQIALDGWPIELSDTAGQRESGESLEQLGIQLARQEAASADLCLWVVETSSPPTWPASLEKPLLAVVNKIDLPAVWDLSQHPDAIHVSARTGEGIQELAEQLVRRLVPNEPAAGVAVPFTDELVRQLEETMS
jgi:tRNA modification GTPase